MKDLREEFFGAVLSGVLKDLLWSPFFDNAAGIEKDHAMRHAPRKAHFVAHDYHGHAGLGEIRHDVQHFFDHFGVERRGWLIKEHNLGLHRKGARNGDALLLPARKLPGEFVGLFGNANNGRGDVMPGRKQFRYAQEEEQIQFDTISLRAILATSVFLVV